MAHVLIPVTRLEVAGYYWVAGWLNFFKRVLQVGREDPLEKLLLPFHSSSELLTVVALDSSLKDSLEVVAKPFESFSSPEMSLLGLSWPFIRTLSVQKVSADYINVA